MEFMYKDIHIGKLIFQLVTEKEIDDDRIVKFLKVPQSKINEMYQSKDLGTEMLLLWSKLLEYDFFRIYSQHLLLYAPPASLNYNKKDTVSSLPQFRKNVYTTEIINFIVELYENKEMTQKEIMDKYNIPKTTLYKWIKKHKKEL
ncbi:CENP-B N-terminal DNA-binding domain-containing protein [Paenimyroides ummariense]|uniref:CENP-B N-terminal DNA-binding domain-containing protein n=1 Tax=Paenimyroides ummariense TaxID=913024 RepID=A0A1I4ZB95_9FLAO|nr:transposase [Paenimyroides ummariense]SFN47468.1 CENP-B N-terminal DNA-binding domain-containing protein [Paenimyroides ummariense]